MNQKIVNYLLLFFTLFTFYNTLIPFQFDVPISELGRQVGKIAWTPYFVDGDLVSLTDIVGNIILFMPLGFLFYLFFFQRRRRYAWILAVLTGFVFSFSIEFLQLLISDRNTAPHDLINNTLGSGIGALAAAVYVNLFANTVRKYFFVLLKKQPLVLVLIFVFMTQLLGALMPFNVTISVSDMVKNVKEANPIPFAYRPFGVLFFDDYSKDAMFQISDTALAMLAAREVPEAILQQVGMLKTVEPKSRRRFLKLLQSAAGKKTLRPYYDGLLQLSQVQSTEEQFDPTLFLETLIFWACIGYIMMLAFRLYGSGWRHGGMLIWLLPPLYFLFMETVQLFISSRISDINDVIGGTLGVYAGYAVFHAMGRVAKGTPFSLSMLHIPALIYLVFMLISGFRPFDWSLRWAVWDKDLEVENLIPFYAYFRNTSLWNIYDLGRSLLYFLPLSLYVSSLLKQRGVVYWRLFLWMSLIGLLIGSVVEFTQLMSVSRVAEITDVLAYGLSGALGTFALYYFEKQIYPVLGRQQRVTEKSSP